MTGEITLRGRVLPIGGLKEKSLAAFRAGIKTIILPDRNEKDLDEIPKPLRRKLNWQVAKNMSDVLKVALIERRTSTHKQRLVEPKNGVRVKPRTPSKSSRPIRKNHRDRTIPLRP